MGNKGRFYIGRPMQGIFAGKSKKKKKKKSISHNTIRADIHWCKTFKKKYISDDQK